MATTPVTVNSVTTIDSPIPVFVTNPTGGANRKMKDYAVCTGYIMRIESGRNSLVSEVKKFIEKGWEVVGGVCSEGNEDALHCQVVVLYA